MQSPPTLGLRFNLNNSMILYALTETQKPSHVGKGTQYTQYVLISKGPISKTGQISRFFKQWLVKFSKLSKNLFCSRFLSNPLVNVFNLSKSKLLLLHSNYHRFSCLDMLKLLCHSLDSAWLYNSQEFERNRFIFVFWANFD